MKLYGFLGALLTATLVVGAPGLAQTSRAANPVGVPGPSRPMAERSEQLVALFNGRAEPRNLFSSAFLAQVPEAQVRGISDQFKAQHGAAVAVADIEAAAPTSGTITIEFERAMLRFNLALEPDPPHRVVGLLLVGADVKDDSLAAVQRELQALPGETSLHVARLGGAAPAALLTYGANRQLAIGSAFKLFLLAELSRSVKAGERKWSDVARLDQRSLPSGLLQDWPAGSPLTLHSLAALMISQSDNSATDTLLHVLGREKVEALLSGLGLSAPERNRPFLSTLEAFALKGGDPGLATDWKRANQAERRALLASRVAAVRPDQVDTARIVAAPAHIEAIEWFASTADLVRTMDWMRLNGGEEALRILSINPGLGKAEAGRFAYFGFKGGSEAGVMNLTFLLQAKDGAWHAIAATWNNPVAVLDEAKLVALVSRSVALIR